MKTLLLMRHAKSSWDQPELADHDRPLSARGKRDAPRIGQLLVDENIVPDHILCSTARRAHKTATRVANAAGYAGQIEAVAELYYGGPKEILGVLRQVDPQRASVLLIAHNPALEELLELLTGATEPLPTSALVKIALDIHHWCDLEAQTPAKMIKLWRPRELP